MIQQTKEARKAVLRKQKSLETQGENITLHGTYLSNLKAQKDHYHKVLGWNKETNTSGPEKVQFLRITLKQQQ